MSLFQRPFPPGDLPRRERELFTRLFEVQRTAGRLELPPAMLEWVAKRFGDVQKVEKQLVVRVTNRVTGEGALFNPLRRLRPLEARQERELDALVEEYRRNCPFCSPEECTPRDVFGRVEGRYCTTAANVAKYDGLHGLVIPREHHPLKFNAEAVRDYFRTAARWFDSARRHAGRPGSWYPFLMWNCLWPAGASVVHGHLQVTLTAGRPYPRIQHLWDNALRYSAAWGSSYFTDLFDVHRALGLGWEESGCRFLAYLTPVKEREVWFMLPPAPPTAENLATAGSAVFSILHRLIKKAGLTSFNVALYLPPGEGDWRGFPLLVRLLDRGSIFSRTADFGAMEIFALSIISSDPFEVAALLRSDPV